MQFWNWDLNPEAAAVPLQQCQQGSHSPAPLHVSTTARATRSLKISTALTRSLGISKAGLPYPGYILVSTYKPKYSSKYTQARLAQFFFLRSQWHVVCLAGSVWPMPDWCCYSAAWIWPSAGFTFCLKSHALKSEGHGSMCKVRFYSNSLHLKSSCMFLTIIWEGNWTQLFQMWFPYNVHCTLILSWEKE